MNEQNQEASHPALFTVKQFCERYPWMKESTLRNRIFFADTNGFNRCVRHLGRKVLISEPDFLVWFEAQQEGASDAD